MIQIRVSHSSNELAACLQLLVRAGLPGLPISESTQNGQNTHHKLSRKGPSMHRLLVAVCATLAGAPTGAFAAPNCGGLLQQGCACAVPIDSAQDGAISPLSEIQGNVLLSCANRY